MKPYSTKYSAVQMRKYRAKNPEKHRAYLRQYRKNHPEKYRLWESARALRRRYGIEKADLDLMWQAQQGCCACCNREMVRGGQLSLSGCIDHDHQTGKVRAILCNGCNVAIAQLGEDPVRCEQAMHYLLKHGK